MDRRDWIKRFFGFLIGISFVGHFFRSVSILASGKVAKQVRIFFPRDLDQAVAMREVSKWASVHSTQHTIANYKKSGILLSREIHFKKRHVDIKYLLAESTGADEFIRKMNSAVDYAQMKKYGYSLVVRNVTV